MQPRLTEWEKEFLIPGPTGQLEVIASAVREPITQRQVVGVICHPHPLFGGTMHNKVVSTLVRAFNNLGVPAVRFNFRGVGLSEGVHDEGKGELQDLLTVIAWAKAQYPDAEVWLAGFSFGAAISAHAATLGVCTRLVSVAPPVPRFDLPTLPAINCPWIVVQGESDDVVIPQDVYAWVETRQPRPRLLRIEGAGHFFHGQLAQLRELVERALLEFAA